MATKKLIVDGNGELDSVTTDPLTAEVSIEVTQSRVLVFPMDMDAEAVSELYLDDKTREAEMMKKALKEMGLMKCLVKEVGPGTYAQDTGTFIPVVIKQGEIVYVFPNNFEYPVMLNGARHLVYHERNIIAKQKK